MGTAISPWRTWTRAGAVGVLGDDLVGQLQLRLALAAEPAVELGVLLLEGGFLGVDQVRPIVGGLQAEVVALLELLGQEGLFQADGEGHDVAFLVAIDLDLLRERQALGGKQPAAQPRTDHANKKTAKGFMTLTP